MYQKILVPLDKPDKECGDVLAMAKDLLVPGGEGILLHIIPPGVPLTVGLHILAANHVEEDECARVKAYLKCLAENLNLPSAQWRSEVAVSATVAKGIVEFARQEEVDLITMHTHDRAGMARVHKGGISEKVQQRVLAEVRVMTPLEAVAI